MVRKKKAPLKSTRKKKAPKKHTAVSGTPSPAGEKAQAVKGLSSKDGQLTLSKDLIQKVIVGAVVFAVLFLLLLAGGIFTVYKVLGSGKYDGGKSGVNKEIGDDYRAQRIIERERVLTGQSENEKRKNARRTAEMYFHIGLDYLRKNQKEKARDNFLKALDYYDGHYGANLELGKLLHEDEIYDEGLKYLKKALVRAPAKDRPGILLRSGDCHFRLKQYDRARDALNKALKLNPRLHDANFKLGEINFVREKYRDAIPDYKRELAINKYHMEAEKRIAECHRRLGNKDEEEKWTQKALQKKNDPDLIRKRVQNLVNQRKFKQAKKMIQEAIKKHPNNGHLWLEKGHIHRRLGELDDAVACFTKAIEMDPNLAEADIALGEVYLVQDKIDKALDTLRKGLRKNNQLAPGHYYLGLALKKKNQINEAEAAFAAAVRITPAYGKAWFELGRVYYQKKNYYKSSTAFDNAARYIPDYGPIYYNHARTLAPLGRWDDLLRKAKTSERYGIRPANLDYLKSLAYLKKGNTPGNNKRCLDNARAALAKQRVFPEAHFNQGKVYARVDELGNGERSFKTALRQNPNYAEAQYELGRVYYRKYELAKDRAREAAANAALNQSYGAFKSATAIDPKYGDAYLELGNVTGIQKKYDEALGYLQKGLANDCDKTRAYYYKGRIKNLQDKLDDALRDFETAVRLNPQSHLGYYGKALVYRKQKQNPAAINALQQALSRKKDLAEAYYILGIIHAGARQYTHGLSNFKQAEKYGKRGWVLYFRMGVCAYSLSDYSSAITYYEKAFEDKKNMAAIVLNLGIAYQETGKNSQAVHFLKKAVALKPEYADFIGYKYLGTAYYHTKAYEAAARQFAAYIKNAKAGKGEAYYMLGHCHFERKDFKAAQEAFRQAVDLVNAGGVEAAGFSGERKAIDAFYMLGKSYQENKQMEEAIAFYKKALNKSPTHFNTLKNMGIVYADLKNGRMAVTYYLKCHQLKPEDDAVIKDIVASYIDFKNYDNALVYAVKYLERDPGNIEMTFKAATCYKHTAQKEKALEYFNKVIALNEKTGQGRIFAREAEQHIRGLQ